MQLNIHIVSSDIFYNNKMENFPNQRFFSILKNPILKSIRNTVIMIIDFDTNCKNYEEKILNNYSFFYFICPKCGAIHSWNRHGTYLRNLSILKDEQICNIKIKILRLMCTSCGSTHAILPNDVVPYCIYSFSFMLRILSEHFVNNESVLSLSEKFNISFQLIYHFISKFLLFFNECVDLLRSLFLLVNILNPSFSDALNIINDYSIKNNFLYTYFCNTNWIFLMSKFHNIQPKPVFLGVSNP